LIILRLQNRMKPLISCIFTLFACNVLAQTGLVTVSGSIYSEQSALPIGHAAIYFNQVVLKADSNGAFKIQAEAGKPYLVKLKCQGCKPFSQKIRFTRDTAIVFFMKDELVHLDEVAVQVQKDNSFGISRLNNVEGTTIYAGKKSEVVYLQDLNANLAANSSRQIFAKVAGINVFENEGSGSSISFGGRGLNPNRISNFNTRQNGYDISADALGYPESYYTPPTEAIDRLEILRGAAGLQFGPQFGGMVNYRFTEAPADKVISGNFRQTGGSFGFVNSFNQLSGTVKKLSYNTFYQYKHYTGWRSRSELNSHNAFASLKYQVNEKLSVRAEYTHLNYLSQQPGGLTDEQFEQDPAQVSRLRNWFRVNWNLAAVSADYKITDRTRMSAQVFGLSAGRDALGVLTRTERGDDTSANRNLLSDVYANYGAELRLLQRYELLKNNSHFLIGARYYQGKTNRKQGDASKQANADFDFLNPDNLENSAYTFPSKNIAFFTENVFQLTTRWSVTPGLRYEYISTASEGYYRVLNRNSAGTIIFDQKVYDNRSNTRDFFLAGIGSQFKLTESMELYANISQNYRSINFNDMRVLNPNAQVDPNLKDESGYTADGGVRGSIKNLWYFDASVFLLQYNDRIGTTLRVDSNTFQIVRYRTNIGRSRNTGVEVFTELDWMQLIRKGSKHKLSTFVNFSYIQAFYSSPDKAYDGKKVEYVPDVIFRTGISYAYKDFNFTYRYSYTAQQFSDATNAPSSRSAIYGIIPAYTIMDLSAGYTWKLFGLSAGINNLANARYFTRRTDGYPGPGIIPADPINYYVTGRLKF
jgi:Fe(3+) dicitrate transport protein